MKKTLRNLLVTVLTMTLFSWAVAVNDAGGGGGGVYTERTAEELRQLLQEYREQREALRHSAGSQNPSYGLSAGNASQVSMGQVDIGARPGPEGYGVGGQWPQVNGTPVSSDATLIEALEALGIVVA